MAKQITQMGKNARNVSDFNNRLVCKLLLDKNYSCIELANIVGLSHTAMGMIIDRLESSNIIGLAEDDVVVKRKKGGQHKRYAIVRDRAYYVCVNLQYGHEAISIFDLAGNVKYFEDLLNEPMGASQFDDVAKKIKSALDDMGIDEKKVVAISVAVPGQINSDTGDVIVSSKVEKSINIKEIFKRAFPGATISLHNDTVCECIGSSRLNEFESKGACALFSHVDYGLSCCMMYDDKHVVSTEGFGGEIGMSIVPGTNMPLHEILSADVLESKCRRYLKNGGDTIKDVLREYGDVKEIRELFSEAAQAFGMVLRNTVNISGCSRMIFSGIICEYPKEFFDELKSVITNTNYSRDIKYQFVLSKVSDAMIGQRYIARENAIDVLLGE